MECRGLYSVSKPIAVRKRTSAIPAMKEESIYMTRVHRSILMINIGMISQIYLILTLASAVGLAGC